MQYCHNGYKNVLTSKTTTKNKTKKQNRKKKHKASFLLRVNLSTLCINTFCVFLKKSLSTHFTLYIYTFYTSPKHYNTIQPVSMCACLSM